MLEMMFYVGLSVSSEQVMRLNRSTCNQNIIFIQVYSNSSALSTYE